MKKCASGSDPNHIVLPKLSQSSYKCSKNVGVPYYAYRPYLVWHFSIDRVYVTLDIIDSLLEDPLDHLERDAFIEDDWKLVQLVATLFRNPLVIQDILLQHEDADLN